MKFTIAQFKGKESFAVKVDDHVVGVLNKPFNNNWHIEILDEDFALARGVLPQHMCAAYGSKEHVLAKFKEEALSLPESNQQRIWRLFGMLCFELEEENITFDGERPPSEVAVARANLMRIWHKVEAEFGRTLTPHQYYDEQRKRRR